VAVTARRLASRVFDALERNGFAPAVWRSRHFVAVLRPDADEILWDDSVTKQLIEGRLKIGLLAERKGTRSRQ
jgi:hypothetical protein